MSDMYDDTVAPGVDDLAARTVGRQSTVGFPYVALDEAVNVASVIFNTHGTSCDDAQLAAGLDTTVTSSKFRSLVSAAKTFGLIDRRSKVVSLTDLGSAIVDPARQDRAMVDAFLTVPLYRKLYDKFAGSLLPQDAGLEAEIQLLGVTPKSVPRARQTLQRSASVAGFFQAGKSRMVRPATTQDPDPLPTTEPDQEVPPVTEPAKAPSGASFGPSDPLLVGLWSKLPNGGSLSTSEQQQWLELARLALAMVYGSTSDEANPGGGDDDAV